eukprot:CAMPEP_0170603762 /NCGR_PEP_ID=MMETSP0224-20130122/19078_1 /TAXON_ID=285029 /ORGANISM="Togula jolla, Strain CCCM 725" /LENGTH=280 /DNA_ID=CAMNT_0010928651 /DNA_START=102 /DNA_END=941 /DNA_ORIENTATION=+
MAQEVLTQAQLEEGQPPVPARDQGLTARNWISLAAFVLNLVITYTSLTGLFGETNSDLSKKYQTPVTPAGWAFSIWGLIFVWEAVFAVAQMFSPFRDSPVTMRIAPWWWSACLFQILWTIFFAQEMITASLVCMVGILVSLMGLAFSTAGLKVSCLEYWLLRGPFSVHLGWIIVATAVNVSVQADASKASPKQLLILALISYEVVCVLATIFATAIGRPDPVVCLVACWAFYAIAAELRDPVNLNDPTRFNAYELDSRTLDMLAGGALGVAGISAVLAAW